MILKNKQPTKRLLHRLFVEPMGTCVYYINRVCSLVWTLCFLNACVCDFPNKEPT